MHDLWTVIIRMAFYGHREYHPAITAAIKNWRALGILTDDGKIAVEPRIPLPFLPSVTYENSMSLRTEIMQKLQVILKVQAHQSTSACSSPPADDGDSAPEVDGDLGARREALPSNNPPPSASALVPGTDGTDQQLALLSLEGEETPPPRSPTPAQQALSDYSISPKADSGRSSPSTMVGSAPSLKHGLGFSSSASFLTSGGPSVWDDGPDTVVPDVDGKLHCLLSVI